MPKEENKKPTPSQKEWGKDVGIGAPGDSAETIKEKLANPPEQKTPKPA